MLASKNAPALIIKSQPARSFRIWELLETAGVVLRLICRQVKCESGIFGWQNRMISFSVIGNNLLHVLLRLATDPSPAL
jgi:hypothetical protein